MPNLVEVTYGQGGRSTNTDALAARDFPTRVLAAKKFDAIDIYPVITSEFCAGRPPVEVLKAVADGGAKIVQLREKSLPKKQILALACEFRKITSSYGMLLIINDHVGIAKDSAADGVHLGQDDCTIEKAAGTAPELILGVSTHSRTEALDAQEICSSIFLMVLFQVTGGSWTWMTR